MWLYNLLHRRRLEQELDDEFQFHLEQQIETGIAQGLTPADARSEAIKALDRIQLRKEECRDMWALNFIDNLTQDLRYAVRVLRKSPAFTTVAVLSLALGIGANTAIFSVMDVLLLRPLPVKEPARLELVRLVGRGYSFSYPMFELIRDRNRAYSETFAWASVKLQTPSGSDMQLVPAAFASGEYFAGLGVAPVLGRVFGQEDDKPASGRNGPAAVISDGFWSARYGRSPAAIGQALVLNGVATSIIGVMPAGFFGAEVGTAPDVWVPLNLQRQLEDPNCISSPSCWYLAVMGRLKPGISEPTAAANLRAISRGIMETLAYSADKKSVFLSRYLRPDPGTAGFTGLRGRVRSPLQVLMALVGFVLLIACANMANLLTARASARQKEIAVRLAMGAARARVVRQFLTESLLLSLAGALGGLLISVWATRLLVTLLSSTVVLDLKPDWRILLFTAAAAIGTGLLFGLAPALRATRGGIGLALKERAHRIQTSGTRSGFTRVVLGVQVAFSILLLAAAGLLASSLVRLLTESPGFDPRGVTVVSIDTGKLPKGAALMEICGRIVQRARALPGSESASLMSETPISNSGWANSLTIPGRADIPEEQRLTYMNAIAPRLFETMRIPLLAGRDFNDADTAQSTKVAVLSENAARRWYPGGALGANVVMGDGTAVRIVGIAGNTKYSNLREQIPPTLYVPYTQWNLPGRIAIRTRVPLSQTYTAFREMLRQVAPGAPIYSIRTMEQQIDESLSTERLTAYLSVFFAILALLLTSVGLYGILAYSVTRRTSEIGVRMALGAQRGNVVWLVIREAMGHTAIGAIAGILAVVASSKLIASLLYGVKPNDPAMMFGAVAVLALVCAAAAWLPARRASLLDPMVALREE